MSEFRIVSMLGDTVEVAYGPVAWTCYIRRFGAKKVVFKPKSIYIAQPEWDDIVHKVLSAHTKRENEAL